MEPSKDPISVRVTKLNTQLVSVRNPENKSTTVISREGLIDALTVLYDECNSDYLKKTDVNISSFIEKHRPVLNEVKCLRVNVSDFEITKVIGHGCFGKVHLVKEIQTGDVYAMKTIKKADCLNNRSIQFEEERNIMATNRSPWLTSLQYAFQDRFNLYFVMEYHPGGDLMGLLHKQGGTIPESAATFYIGELVLGLNDLHAMGYVHRDVKPENILLDRCGHIKLADFGSSAKLNKRGVVTNGIPIGTPDYIAPEVLQSNDNKNKQISYGISCDYWSVGVLAYQLTLGATPFASPNTTGTYTKIMNYKLNLRFPPEIALTQGYIMLIKNLLTESNSRLCYEEIIKHPLFKNVDFNSLRNQVPPYVPKIDSIDDTSNFSDVPAKKNEPNIENFKTKTQFSGRNLPFIGFTYTHDLCEYKPLQARNGLVKDEKVEELLKEVNKLQKKLIKADSSLEDREKLERKLEEMLRRLENMEGLRNNLERDLASSIAECGALKRTLELERKERTDIEHKAIELIKSAKLKWENSERTKLEALNLEIVQQNEQIQQLTATNALLNEQLQHAFQLENKHKSSVDNLQHLNRQSIVGLESRLEKVTTDSHSKLSLLQSKLEETAHQKHQLENKIAQHEETEGSLRRTLERTEAKYKELSSTFESNRKLITELETKLKSYETSTSKASKDNRKLIDEHEELERRLNEAKKELERERANCSNLKTQVHDLNTKLETSKQAHQRALEHERAKSETTLRETQERLTRATEEKNSLELKLDESRTNELSNKLKVQTLEDLLQRLETGVSKLETDYDKENVFKEQIERLEKQLIQVHENAAVEKQELGQLKTKLWRTEKDLSNAEIDKRIYKRELKESEDENKKLTAQIVQLEGKLAENAKMHEAALLELNELNENLANEIVKLKEVTRCLEEKLLHERGRGEHEKDAAVSLKAEIDADKCMIARIAKDLEIAKEEKKEFARRVEILQEEKAGVLRMLEEARREKGLVFGELERCRQELQNTHLNLNALREACTILETQLIEYEKLHASYETKEKSLNQNTEKLILELAQAKEEIQQTKRIVNEEKSLKLMSETKCKRLAEEIDAHKSECESYKQQSIDFKEYSTNLTEELTLAEEKILDYEVTIKSYERQLSDLINENAFLKEESSSRLTHLSEVKASNYQLSQQVAELKRDNDDLLESLRELQDTLTQKANFHREREMKADATLQQQIKLIDFLQSKVEESKKKKTLSDMLFGHSKKENQPPVALNYKDLEHLLSKERETNKDLRHEIAKLKSELSWKSGREADTALSPRTKLAMEKLAQSPDGQRSDLLRQNSTTQRMYHNIPHRFESKLCTKQTKCTHCSNQITLGRNVKYCTECHLHVHPYCAKFLPKTCGVPTAFVKHYSESLTKLTSTENLQTSNAETCKSENINIEGWVKIPVRSSWERHYACLTSSALKIYPQPPNGGGNATEPLQCLELRSSNSKAMVILEPVISEIDAPVAGSDLPFIIKVEVTPKTTCWPPESIIIMTLTIQDKEKWFKALQAVFHSSDPKYTGELVIKHDKQLHINCLTDLDEETKLLGTESGLYSLRKSTLLRIHGPLSIHQVTILKSIKLAVMIADVNRYLITCNLDHLTNLTRSSDISKPTLIFKSVNVNNMEGFHLFQASKSAKNLTLCVATSKQLVIMSYEHALYEFVPIRILDTAEPTSCILFTEHSIIVGANKFFEIDLMSFEADEFLDASDKKLAQAVLCYNVGSFPVGVMQVGSNPIEYLLCFHEFAIFADEYGRCSRVTDIKWTRLPRAFHYHRPYLYVVHFSSVEIIKIISDTCNLMKNSVDSLMNVESYRIELDNPRYLGNGTRGIYVTNGEEVRYVEGATDGDTESESQQTQEEENASDEFSFTSSMVHSLDGNLSEDDESSSNGGDEVVARRKRVTFKSTETDL